MKYELIRRSSTATLAMAGCFLTWIGIAGAAELTFDISDFHYREEDDAGEWLMEDNSDPGFASLGARNWDGPKKDGDFGFIYNAEVTVGRTKYTSPTSGTVLTPHYRGRFEGSLAYRYNKQLTPYLGLGLRTLFDNSGGHNTTTGEITHDRLNILTYLPVGILYQPTSKWSFKGRFNWVIKGWHITYTSRDGFGYPDAHNKQDEGWGMDFNANYQINDKWSAYGFFRYWSIDRSDSDSGDVPF